MRMDMHVVRGELHLDLSKNTVALNFDLGEQTHIALFILIFANSLVVADAALMTKLQNLA